MEEGASNVGEDVVADILGGGGCSLRHARLDVNELIGLGLDGVRGKLFGRNGIAVLGVTLGILAKQDGGATAVVLELALHALTLTGHALADGVGADGAILNVDDAATALEHEADVWALGKGQVGVLSPLAGTVARGAVEVRRQLGAVAVLDRAADGVLDGWHQGRVQVGEVDVGLFEDAALEAQLLGVVEHLELAASTGGEVAAGDAGVVAEGGGLGDGDEVGERLLFATQMAEDLDLDGVTGDGEGDDVDLVGALAHGEAVAGGRQV